MIGIVYAEEQHIPTANHSCPELFHLSDLFTPAQPSTLVGVVACP